jgi:hypothetical protein
MAHKTGRNEPCYCGSGKKYKKCCMGRDIAGHMKEEDREFEELLTGTPMDEYFGFHRMLSLYSQAIRQFEAEGKEFDAADKEFIEMFKPGEDGWIPDSFHANWLLYDFRFGKSKQTVCERFIEKDAHRLVAPGPENLRIISASYFTFYAVVKNTETEIIFEDIYNLKQWHMQKLGRDRYEKTAVPGEIWFTRLIGVPARCYNAATPYFFGSHARENFLKGLRGHVETYMRAANIKGPVDERIYGESCKNAMRMWAHYMLIASGKIKDTLTKEKIKPVKVMNEEGDDVCMVKIFYTVTKSDGLHEKMESTGRFTYDKNHREWIWLDPKTRKSLIGSKVLGVLREEKGKITAEVQSLNRAAALKKILADSMGGYLEYALMDVKTIAEIPGTTQEQKDKMEKAAKQKLENPQIQDMLAAHTENYYLKEWINNTVPALGNIKPVDAVKNAAGREHTAELINHMEQMQNIMPEQTFDFNMLRAALRIVPSVKKGGKSPDGPAAPDEDGKIFVFDIVIEDIEPEIWRRVAVNETTTLEELAVIILEMFGWHGGHLHGYFIGKKEYGVPSDEDMSEVIDERKIKLKKLTAASLKKFLFVYDFGDDWRHGIKLVKTGPAEAGKQYPLCLDGARGAPPEDCGSVPGYYEVMEALKNRNKPTKAQKARLEWLGEYYDPEYFDRDEINENLKEIKQTVKQYRDLLL